MKPIKLTMKAFGSYGEETTIDFTRPNQKLFLITGDTGAGKTTIFDAITYALYGKNSSMMNSKNGLEIQSQYADFSLPPYVDFTFSEIQNGQECIYKIHRELHHLHKNKSGKNAYRPISEKITLLLPDNNAYIGDIQKKINEIIGLTREQFMQVAMLAQGEFMKLLRTESKDKKVIFRQLFKTEIFQRLVDEIKTRNKAMQGELNLILKKCQSHIETLALPDNLPADNPLPSLKARLCQTSPNIAEMETLLQELNALIEEYQKEVQNQQNHWNELSRQRDQLNAQIAKTQELSKNYANLDQLLEQEKDLAAEQETQSKNEQLAQGIIQAYEIKGIYDRLSDKEKDLRKTQDQKENTEKLLPEQNTMVEQAQTAEVNAQVNAQKTIAAYTAIKTKVDDALKQMMALETAQKELTTAKKQLATAQKTQANTQKEQTDYTQKLNLWQKRVHELEHVKAALAKAESRQETLRKWTAACTALTNLQKQLQQAGQKASAAQEKFLQDQAAYKQAQEEYEHAHQQYLNDQAGILAEELTANTPCPVCGSLEHPHPYVPQGNKKPIERGELNALEKRKNTLNDAQIQSAGNAKGANEKAESLREQFTRQLNELQQNITSLTHIERPFALTDIENILQKWQKKNTADITTFTVQTAELDKIQAALARSTDELNHLQKAMEQASAAVQAADGCCKSIQGRITTLHQQQTYANSQTAQAELRQAEQTRDKAQHTLTAAQNTTRKAQAVLQSSKTILSECLRKLPLLQNEVTNLQEQYQKACEERKLSAAAWKSLTESYSLTQGKNIQQACQKYKEQQKTLQGKKAALLTTIGEQKRPELCPLTQRQQDIDSQWKTADHALQTTRHLLQQNSSIAAYLTRNLAQRDAKISAAAALNSLCERLSGSVKGEASLDIETYVQRYYLEKILYAANIRFSEMSGGQYELRLAAPEDRNKKGEHGLDLNIFSTVTGQERDIKTLSGGESFMAALSLALGLSDQIQLSSSAINLDIMFIDEGFGSLDDHSRSQAIKVLKRLSNGDKLIGIISHVTELKQEIDNQLIVRKDNNGSHVHWQIS